MGVGKVRRRWNWIKLHMRKQQLKFFLFSGRMILRGPFASCPRSIWGSTLGLPRPSRDKPAGELGAWKIQKRSRSASRAKVQTPSRLAEYHWIGTVGQNGTSSSQPCRNAAKWLQTQKTTGWHVRARTKLVVSCWVNASARLTKCHQIWTVDQNGSSSDPAGWSEANACNRNWPKAGKCAPD